MANRLIRYEAALFRRSLADGFRGPGDFVLLVLLATIGFAWLRDRAATGGAFALPSTAIWFAALAGPLGFTWQRLANRRLTWLAGHSPLAPDALEAGNRRVYLGLAHLLGEAPLIAAALLLGVAAGRTLAAIAIALAAYAVGAGLSFILPANDRRSRRTRPIDGFIAMERGRAALALILRGQTFGRGHPFAAAALFLIASFALTLAAGWWGRDRPQLFHIAVQLLPSLILLLCSARLDAWLLGFLPFAGYGPGFAAFAVTALPIASFAAAGLAIVLVGASQALPTAALLHAGFVVVAIARAWLYPGRSARSVDFQLQLEFMGLLAIFFLVPPLAIAAAGWRLWHFQRRYRGLRWIQP